MTLHHFFSKCRLFIFAALLGVLSLSPAYAWNSNGHKIIAQIAFDQLTPQARARVNDLTKVMFHARSAKQRLYLASVWPDVVRYDDVTAFNTWHYINTPYVIGNIKTPPLAKENVAWAVQQSYQVVSSRKAHRFEKGLFLTFLIHFVGDAHQPMHCITFYSKRFPNGDKGGNAFKIRSGFGRSLHQLWDGGLGLFKRPGRFSNQRVMQFANKFMQEYPKSYFGSKIQNTDPWSWTRHGFDLAKEYAYQLKPYSRPSDAYIAAGRKVAVKQLVLAGYRLGYLLNKAFGQKQKKNNSFF